MTKPIHIFFLLILIAGTAHSAEVLDIAKYGAVGDGTTLCTAAIQKAIDECSAKGGGTVKIPAGRFVSGTLILKDNVTLSLDPKAELLGSTNIADYRMLDTFKTGNGATLGYVFIGAMDSKNVGIEGAGLIDGRGVELKAAAGGSFQSHRPFLVRFSRCTGVSVKDVHLKGAGAWTMPFFQCKQVAVQGVSIVCKDLGNNDGIDVDSCQGVAIKNCTIDTRDDSICIKATSALPSKDIAVTSCTLGSNCGGVKFGTESLGDFENIAITKCRVTRANLGGIKILSVDGAKISNVAISDITMDSAKMAIFVRLGARLKTFRPEDKPRPVGTISGVVIKNVKASVSSLGTLISGIPDHQIDGIAMENIDLTLPGGGKAVPTGTVIPENEKDYPEVTMFKVNLPAYGIYARHIKGLAIKNLKMDLTKPDARPGLVFQDAQNLDIPKELMP